MAISNESSDENVLEADNATSTTEPLVTETQGYTSSDLAETLRRMLLLMASPLTDEVGSTKSVLSGLTTIFVAGTALGLLAAPGNPTLTPPYRSVSAAIGYIYFLAWSVSFYPQVISNFKRKSTDGLSADFVVLNVIGFGCYAAYNAAFFWNTAIQEDYKRRYGPDAEITVQSNDVAFAIHALVLSAITLCQIVYYNNFGSTGGENSSSTRICRSAIQLSKPILVVILGIFVVCIGYPVLLLSTKRKETNYVDEYGNDDGLGKYNWLDFLYILSYIKIMISLIKYIPQVLLNIQRKSTKGWSIWNILLDFTGGTLSDLQLVLDCANLKDFSGITHNKAKFALGSLSIVFDIIFLAQHYCLYAPGRQGSNEQTEPLLPSGAVTDDSGEDSVATTEGRSSPEPEMIFV